MLPLIGPALSTIGVSNLLPLMDIGRAHGRFCGDNNNHLYVSYVGAPESKRGIGSGGVVLRLYTSIADQCKSYVYLENSKFENIGFYNHNGL